MNSITRMLLLFGMVVAMLSVASRPPDALGVDPRVAPTAAAQSGRSLNSALVQIYLPLVVDHAISEPRDNEYQAYQQYYQDIGVVAMWSRGISGATKQAVIVAVIDTGVDVDHPDLVANLIPGYDFVEADGIPQDRSTDSHGSMIAGIIAAEINGFGVVGVGGGDVAAGTKGLQVLPIRIAQESSGISCAASAAAINYAVDRGAHVINMSYAGSDPCDEERAAIQRAYDAGVALIAGAGNTGESTPQYPAAYGAGTNDRLVIAVAGVLPSGSKALGSSYGTWVDISAPYRLIRSTDKSGGYQSASGTSFSAALVSGFVGVLMGYYGWDRDQAVAVMLSTTESVDAINPDYRGQLGAGRINADVATRQNQMHHYP